MSDRSASAVRTMIQHRPSLFSSTFIYFCPFLFKSKRDCTIFRDHEKLRNNLEFTIKIKFSRRLSMNHQSIFSPELSIATSVFANPPFAMYLCSIYFFFLFFSTIATEFRSFSHSSNLFSPRNSIARASSYVTVRTWCIEKKITVPSSRLFLLRTISCPPVSSITEMSQSLLGFCTQSGIFFVFFFLFFAQLDELIFRHYGFFLQFSAWW